jgi:hypothetical protein
MWSAEQAAGRGVTASPQDREALRSGVEEAPSETRRADGVDCEKHTIRPGAPVPSARRSGAPHPRRLTV